VKPKSKRNSIVVAMATAISFFSGHLASAKSYDCSVNAPNGGYVTDRYIFSYDPDKGKVSIFDALIKQEIGEPMPAKVSANTDKKLAFGWSVNLSNNVGQSARILYRAAYFKENDKFTVIGNVGGGEYIGSWNASGRCKVLK
jgi:hypothetical protein